MCAQWVHEAARRLVAARAGQGLQCRLPRQRLLSLEVVGVVPGGSWVWWQGSHNLSLLLLQAALVVQNPMLLSQAALVPHNLMLLSQAALMAQNSMLLIPRQRLRLYGPGKREVV